jgi:cytochrome c peroxidase
MTLQKRKIWLIGSLFVAIVGMAVASVVLIEIVSGKSATENCFEYGESTLGLPVPNVARCRVRAGTRVAARELGRKLFFDRRLSFNGTMSCAMCHVPSQGFTTNTSRTSVGMEGKSLRRNAPTVLNVAWQMSLFHDGRESSLTTQAWMPLLHPDEMANPSIGYVLDRIASLGDYDDLFRRAFGDPRPTIEAVGTALATYEAGLASVNSRFDRWRYGADETALSVEEQAGFNVFTGKGRCNVCHLVGQQFALFADNKFHNTGVAQRKVDRRSVVVQLAPSVQTVLTDKVLPSLAQTELPDFGRYEITLRIEDLYAFKTPSLRNVARTGPYMHDGSMATLEEVVEFYNQGGGDVPGKSTTLLPLALTQTEQRALIAFLYTLNGENPGKTEPATAESTIGGMGPAPAN